MSAIETRNLLGIHALVWTASWAQEDFEAALRVSAALGYDLIEVPRFEPAKVDIDWFAGRLQAHGLRVAITTALPGGADISSTDPEQVRRGERFLLETVETGVALNAHLLGGILYSCLGKYSGAPTIEGRANAAAVLRTVAQEARARGLPTCLEIVNRYETNLLNTCADGLHFLDEVGEDHLTLHLDTYHMHIEETDPCGAIRAAGDSLGYFHVGQNDRGPIDRGTIPLPAIFQALRDASYSGAITFESFSSEVLDEELSNDIAIWRNTWTDGEAVARDAHAAMIDLLS